MITIANINAFDNDYFNSDNFTAFNKLCVENQKNFVIKYNKLFRYKLFNYDAKIVIEAKKNAMNVISKITNDFKITGNDCFKDYDNYIKSNTLKISTCVDIIKLYILSKIPNLLFLDDDVFIHNKFKFIKSFINKNFCLEGINCFYNGQELELVKKIYMKRLKYEDIIDTDFLELINIKFGGFEGYTHLGLSRRYEAVVYNINSDNDLKKLDFSQCACLKLNKQVNLSLIYKIDPYKMTYQAIKYFDFDDDAKKQYDNYLKLNNIKIIS